MEDFEGAHHSPQTLQNLCLHNVSLALYKDRKHRKGYVWPYFLQREVFLPTFVSDHLLRHMTKNRFIDKDTLALFSPEVCALRNVSLNKGNLHTSDLRILKGHKVVELAVKKFEVPVNNIIGCLGEWSLANLVTLNVSGGTFCDTSKLHISVSLSKLEKLRILDVSNTEFNDNDLMIISQDLNFLESLNLSRTPVGNLQHLKFRRDTIKSLGLFELRASHGKESLDVLRDLTKLEHLDVSDDVHSPAQLYSEIQKQTIDVRLLLSDPKAWPHLKSLDISGKDTIDLDGLRAFVRAHELEFLGLSCVPTHISGDDMFALEKDKEFRFALKISGEASERQLLQSLSRHQDRPAYMQKALCYLFEISHGFDQPKLEFLKPVIRIMNEFKEELGIQMAGTACAYNMCKKNLGQMLHPHYLLYIAECCLNAMVNFPHHLQLQKNALLTLCNDRILQDVTFDRFRCARLVMECLCNFNDAHMKRMCVAICGIVAAKIPTSQTSELGQEVRYMQQLLRIVREKLNADSDDLTLRFTLSALWNLTDESPKTCTVFLKEGGLTLFSQLLEAFQSKAPDEKSHVETKLLGLMNNLAEVPVLRQELMAPRLLTLICDLLQSKNIDTSYFAGGIIAHLLNDEACEWTDGYEKETVLEKLSAAILGWQSPEGEMVAYRSFKPFFPLLTSKHQEVQLWAVWAIHHVCSKNGARYCCMLAEEGGVPLLERVLSSCTDNKCIIRLCQMLIQVLQDELGEWKVSDLMETSMDCLPSS